MAVTVVATVEPNNSPPRVRLDVTDTGSPTVTQVNVTRVNGSTVAPVRTVDGGPLLLSTSGSNRVGVLYDYEAPLGVPSTYSTAEQPTNVSAAVTLNSAVPWLVRYDAPGLSVPLDFRIGSFDSTDNDVVQGKFRPLGRDTLVTVTDGSRKADESSFIAGTDTLAALAALNACLASGGVVYLNVPVALGMGVSSAYINLGRTTTKRRTDIGTDPYRDTTVPFEVVAMPVGGQQAQRTYADVLAENATYASLAARYPTYTALLTG